MVSILKKNKGITLFCIVLLLYYIRVLRTTVMMTGEDHYNAILSLAMLIMAGWGFINYRNKLKVTPMLRILLLFFAYILFLDLIYFDSINKVVFSIQWILPFLIAFYFYKSPKDEPVINITMVILAIITSITLFIGMSLGNYVMALSTMETEDSDTETIVNIVAFAMLTIPFIMMLKSTTIKWIVLFVILLATLVSSRRIATICLIASVLLSIPNSQPKQVDKKRKSKGLYTIIIIALLGYFTYIIVTGDLQEFFELTLYRFQNADNSQGSGRIPLWNAVISAWGNNSVLDWIFGHGYLGVGKIVRDHTASHNEFLEIITDFGIIGLFLYVSFHLRIISRMFYLYSKMSPYRFSYTASYIIFFMYSLLGNVIIYPAYALPIFFYWGMVEKKILLERKPDFFGVAKV